MTVTGCGDLGHELAHLPARQPEPVRHGGPLAQRKQQGTGLTAVTCLVTLERVNCLRAVGQVPAGKVTGRIVGARFRCSGLRAE